MRISELLDLPLLRDAGVRIVVGADRLDRQVDWVHTGEIADIARFLNGGEVLLTAATGIGQSERAHRRYVRELAEAGVAGVIFELGRGLSAIPPEMVDEARRTDLVLVSLDSEVPFVAVTHVVHTQLISSKHAALVRAMEIDEALSQAILDGSSLSTVLDLLGQRLQNPVVLEDAAHQVVAVGRSAGSFTPILRKWSSHSRAEHAPRRGAAVNVAELKPRCAWTDIMLRGESWGRLHILELDSPLDEVARLTLGRAGTSIAFLLLAERDEYLREEAEHALIRGIASGADFNGEAFLDRATGLGISFTKELVLLMTRPDEDLEGAAQERSTSELAQACRAALAGVGWPGVVGRVDDAVVIIAGAEGRDDGRALHFSERITATSSATRMGMSRSCRAAALPRAFREAVMAHRVAPLGGDGHLQNFEDLALLRLLAPLGAGPELATFVEAELGELLAYDEKHKSDLLKTLDAFLQANGNKQEMGVLLHLRRRSVYYRLERIEQILGYSLDLPDRRARLYVALRSRELLSERRSLHPGELVRG